MRSFLPRRVLSSFPPSKITRSKPATVRLSALKVASNRLPPCAVETVSFSSSGGDTALSLSPPPSITLYQYSICPFCHKAKALLSYAGLEHDIVEVNPLTKKELKPWSGEYRKVPIATIDGEQFNGSDSIVNALLDHPHVISALEGRWQLRSKTMSMADFRSSKSAVEWMKFANDDLAALLYPNICRSMGDSFRAFGYVRGVEAFSPMQKLAIRSIGSLAMFLAASKIKSKRGITDERAALNRALAQWEDEGLERGKREFASGLDEPNMGDMAVFGTIRSVEGLPAHDETIKKRGGALKDWYDRMNSEFVCHGPS